MILAVILHGGHRVPDTVEYALCGVVKAALRPPTSTDGNGGPTFFKVKVNQRVSGSSTLDLQQPQIGKKLHVI